MRHPFQNWCQECRLVSDLTHALEHDLIYEEFIRLLRDEDCSQMEEFICVIRILILSRYLTQKFKGKYLDKKENQENLAGLTTTQLEKTK